MNFTFLLQVLVGIMVAMITSSTSFNSAAAVMLPRLMSNSSDLPLTAQQGVWFGRCQWSIATRTCRQPSTPPFELSWDIF